MIRCMIIEDEPLAKDLLERYIMETDGLTLVAIAEEAEEALSEIESNKPDLLFLDIKLPGISGLNFYKTLIKRPKVIFTTAYPEYAVDGFELEAIDYLLKPFAYERFLSAISKVKILLDSTPNQDVIIIKEDKKSHRIKLSSISYIESLGDYVKFHTLDRTYLSSETLKSLELSLPSSFIRTHKSYIVSLDAIDYMEGNRVKVNDQMLPVGYAYRESVSKLFKR